MIALLFQMSLGLFIKILENVEDIDPMFIKLSRLLHRILGYSFILIGKINCIVGWIIY